MEYVMVPVPQELVPQVLQYLQWNVGGGQVPLWDDDAIVRFVEALDDKARALLLCAARASREVVELSIEAAARAIDGNEREVLGLVMELNDAVRAVGGPAFVLATALQHGTTETGPQAWTLNMPGDVASLILTAVGIAIEDPSEPLS